MARLIQSTIKTPLADEVLFGRLKDGGAVRVVVRKPEEGEKDALGFEFPEGRVTPKPEKDVTNAVKKHKRAKAKTVTRRKDDKKDDKGGGGSGNVRTVPKVPLVKA